MTIGLTAANAAKAYLASLDLELVTLFYAEIENPDPADGNAPNTRSIPSVTCFATNATEYPFRSGNWNLNLHFRLVVSGDDDNAAALLALFEEVFNAIQTDTILADITAAAAASDPVVTFTAFGFFDDVRQADQQIEGRNRIVEIVLPINCCPKTIS